MCDVMRTDNYDAPRRAAARAAAIEVGISRANDDDCACAEQTAKRGGGAATRSLLAPAYLAGQLCFWSFYAAEETTRSLQLTGQCSPSTADSSFNYKIHNIQRR